MTVPAAVGKAGGEPRPHAPSVDLRCAAGHPAPDALLWRCPVCDGPWETAALPRFDAEAIDNSTWSLWRYAAMLPDVAPVTLGEGGTPLVPVTLPEGTFRAKLEFLSPTGSYKDRGTALVVSHLRALGVEEVVEDSSGNAGASLAAYAAAAGLRARVYVPAHASAAKKRQIAGMGAEVIEVPGGRGAAGAACRREIGHATYASHCWNPLFLSGQSTCAWEIWEQLGGTLPAAVVCPVGQGNLFLGLARGFAALHEAGLTPTVPRMYAVQSTACAPVARAWRTGRPIPAAVDEGTTIAEGILTTSPVRGAEIMRVLHRTGGGALAVPDDAVRAAQLSLRGAGLSVEPTSAVPVAALPLLRDHLAGAEVVVPLTGSGLKSL